MNANTSTILLLITVGSLPVVAGYQTHHPGNGVRERSLVTATPPKLVYAPEPSIPELATLARIRGAVQIVAEIDEYGSIASLRVQSGHPFLIAAALDAARRYRYQPGSGNGLPARFIIHLAVQFNTPITPLELVSETEIWSSI